MGIYAGDAPSWEDAVCARLRDGATWEEAARWGPPWASLRWFRRQPLFQKAYTEGRARRLQRHAEREARREVACWFSGEVYEWRPCEQ